MALAVRDPNTGKLNSWVWISGAGLAAMGGFFLLSRNSASTGGGSSTVSGGGGGSGLGDTGTGGTDTQSELTAMQGTIGDILDRLDNLQPGPPGPAGPAGPPGPAGPGSGSVIPGANTITGYSVLLVKPTAVYSAAGKYLSTINSKTPYATRRIKVNGVWHYVITSGSRKGEYFKAEPYFKTTPIYAAATATH